MKFEEVLAQVRAGKKFEDFEGMNKAKNCWFTLHEETFIQSGNLLESEFRLKTSGKIKRYQIIYTDVAKKNFYLTWPHEKYTAQEFKDSFHNDIWAHRRCFHAIIPESVEEFDR
jgi:hypothetical protein